MSWNNAVTYCNWVGRRLPTEAEWEKAARGTDGRMHAWGNDIPSNAVVNYDNDGLYDQGTSVPVGSYPTGASPYGVLDMSGNISEWVSDLYYPSYYKESPASNPIGPETGIEHVYRGANFTSQFDDGEYIITLRSHANVETYWAGLGMRCALSAE